MATIQVGSFSKRRDWASRQAISFLMQQGIENPGVISLAAGFVDNVTLPAKKMEYAAKMVFSDSQRARIALQYGTTAGAIKLRSLLLEHVKMIDMLAATPKNISHDNLVLTTGSQQLLSLVGNVLFDPGDICIVAAPTYFVFLGTLEGLGANIISVPADDKGICPEKLDALLLQIEQAGNLDRVKLVYIVSDFDNPRGVSVAEERRDALVETVKKWREKQPLFLLEDAAYRELSYDEPPPASLWSRDVEHDTVIYAGTFSKSFSPGLRVGFGILPTELVAAVCDCKGNEDFGSSHMNQQLFAEVVQSGEYVKHVAFLCDSYRKKRDAMLAAAETYFSDIEGTSWVHPGGGLYVWMSLPDSIRTCFDSPLFDCAVKKHNVMYVPGELSYGSEDPNRKTNEMRLSFGVQDEAGIDAGMKQLATAIREVIA